MVHNNEETPTINQISEIINEFLEKTSIIESKILRIHKFNKSDDTLLEMKAYLSNKSK